MPCTGRNWSSRSTTAWTRPLRGSSIWCFSSRKAGLLRSTSPTWLTTPAASTAAVMAAAPSRVVASGFSQNTGSPRSAAAATRRGCSLVHVHTYTASTESRTASSLSMGSAPEARAKDAVRSGSRS